MANANASNVNQAMASPPLRRRWWFGFVLLLIATAAWLVYRGPKIDTDLLALLPPTERDPVVAEALDHVARHWTAKTIFLVSHPEFDQAQAAAQQLAEALVDSGLFRDVQAQLDPRLEEAYFDLYFPHRAQLPGPRGDSLFTKAEQALYSPLTSIYGDLLEKDPLFLFAGFLEQLPKLNPAMQVRGGWLTVESQGQHHILLTATNKGEAFHAQGGTGIEPLIQAWQTRAEERWQATLRAVGVVRYASRAAQQARGEVTLISTGSTLAVVLLFLIVFRGPRPLLWSFIPILTGLITAFVMTLLVFDRIHVITLGFGASLIGVCVDYNFHFFCERFHHPKQTPAFALRSILAAIGLGALTSAIGYAGLALAPFPGLRQMAVFSTSGLLAAFFTVVCLFGHAHATPPQKPPRGYRRVRQLTTHLDKLCWNGWATAAAVGLLVIMALGLYRLDANDDIRSLQKPPADLQREETVIKQLIGNPESGRFLLVEGHDRNQVLAREEAARDFLAQHLDEPQPFVTQGISQFVPSLSSQRARWRELQQTLIDDGALDAYLTRMGFEPAFAAAIEGQFSGEMPEPLPLENWLKHDASRYARDLWLGATARGFASMVLFNRPIDQDLASALEQQVPGVRYIDKVADVSRVMKRYRQLTMLFAAISYALILLLLLWRYGFLHGLRTFCPPIIAALFALASLGWLGVPINLFHIIALLLVLGIGIDYTIFMAESGVPSTLLAVLLSFITTCLSFGFLALSGNPVLQAFGTTLVIGLLAALVLAPLARRS